MPRTTYTPWTTTRQRKMVDLVGRIETGDIADAIGATRCAVLQRMGKLKLNAHVEKRRVGREMVQALRDSGHSDESIKYVLGIRVARYLVGPDS